jgi:3-hydroxyacyl-[acyl-carrier-protein] dehydratase
MDPIELLPHRPPMRLLEAVVDLVPGVSAHARRTLRPGDFFFDGHFPGEPIVPAVILVEMIAQAGGLAAAVPSGEGAAAPLRLRVAAIGPCKFPDAARPGARLEIVARVAGRMGPLVKIEGEVRAQGRLVAAGSVTLAEAR